MLCLACLFAEAEIPRIKLCDGPPPPPPPLHKSQRTVKKKEFETLELFSQRSLLL